MKASKTTYISMKAYALEVLCQVRQTQEVCNPLSAPASKPMRCLARIIHQPWDLVPHVPEPLLAASACCSICVFLVATAVAVRVSYPLSFLAVMPNWLGCSQMCKPPTDFRISTAFVQNEPLILACTAAAVHPVPQWKILQLSDNVALPPQTAQDFITCRTSWLVSRQSLFFCKEHFWDLIPMTTALLVLAPLAEIGIC